MGRPKKTGMDYFPHDVTARFDERIKLIEVAFSHAGYSTYFKLLERIYSTKSGMLDLSDVEMRAVIAQEFNLSLAEFEAITAAMVKRGLFDAEAFSKWVLTSARVQETMKPLLDWRKRSEEKSKEEKSREEIRLENITPQETPEETSEETPEEKTKYAERIFLTIAEYEKLKEVAAAEGISPDGELTAEIQKASDWLLQKGNKWANCAAGMRNWIKRAGAIRRRATQRQAAPRLRPLPFPEAGI